MIKGAFIYAAGLGGGLVIGVIYGLTLGTKLTSAINTIADKMDVEKDIEKGGSTARVRYDDPSLKSSSQIYRETKDQLKASAEHLGEDVVNEG